MKRLTVLLILFVLTFAAAETSLDVDIVTSPNSIILGDTFTVAAKVTNIGDNAATNLQVVLSLPDGLATTESITKNLGSLDIQKETTVMWDVEGISAGSYSDLIVVNVLAQNAAQNSATSSVNVLSPALIVFSLSVPRYWPRSLGALTVTASAQNFGDVDAESVVVTSNLGNLGAPPVETISSTIPARSTDVATWTLDVSAKRDWYTFSAGISTSNAGTFSESMQTYIYFCGDSHCDDEAHKIRKETLANCPADCTPENDEPEPEPPTSPGGAVIDPIAQMLQQYSNGIPDEPGNVSVIVPEYTRIRAGERGTIRLYVENPYKYTVLKNVTIALGNPFPAGTIFEKPKEKKDIQPGDTKAFLAYVTCNVSGDYSLFVYADGEKYANLTAKTFNRITKTTRVIIAAAPVVEIPAQTNETELNETQLMLINQEEQQASTEEQIREKLNATLNITQKDKTRALQLLTQAIQARESGNLGVYDDKMREILSLLERYETQTPQTLVVGRTEGDTVLNLIFFILLLLSGFSVTFLAVYHKEQFEPMLKEAYAILLEKIERKHQEHIAEHKLLFHRTAPLSDQLRKDIEAIEQRLKVVEETQTVQQTQRKNGNGNTKENNKRKEPR